MASRVDNLEKRKKKVTKKTISKIKKAGEAGKEKKMDRVAARGDKKLKRINKKIDKSMARQEERGMRKAKRQKINDYTKGVKTSGMRKKAKAKAMPQKVLSALKKTPKLFLEDMRDGASTLKKGAQAAAMKVKNRKKKNR